MVVVVNMLAKLPFITVQFYLLGEYLTLLLDIQQQILQFCSLHFYWLINIWCVHNYITAANF